MDRQEAYRILEIVPPFTERVLKSTFRAKAMEAHPDKGGTSNQFRDVKEAFDLLLADAGKDVEAVDAMTTVEGVDISTLGKGLRVSASRCADCSGRGYRREVQYSECPSCLGHGNYGSSLSDWLRAFSSQFSCHTCGGTGRSKSSRVRHWVCTHCNGAGEVAVFNPVFIKGSMTQKQQRQSVGRPKEVHQEDRKAEVRRVRLQEQQLRWAAMHQKLTEE